MQPTDEQGIADHGTAGGVNTKEIRAVMRRVIAIAAFVAGGSLIVAPTAGATLVCPPGVTNPIYCANVTPPTVVTGAAKELTPTSATVTGTVNTYGAATTYYFQYGTSTAYGSQTAAGSLAASTTNTAVSAAITGLTPGKTYH